MLAASRCSSALALSARTVLPMTSPTPRSTVVRKATRRTLLVVLVGVLVATGSYFSASWISYLVPEARKHYYFSQTAPVPPLPAADPAAVAAQEVLTEAGGARWTSETVVNGRLVEEAEGVISSEGGSCSSEARITNKKDDGAPRPSNLHVIDGDRAAMRLNDSEVVLEGEEATVEYTEGEWEGSFPHQTAHAPTMLGIFNAASACTFLVDVSRSVLEFREQPDVSHLPAVGDGVTRYVGGVSVWGMNEVAFHHTYLVAKEGTGHAPSNRTMYVARPTYAAVAAKVHSVTLDVDPSGAPVSLWVVMGNPGTTTPMVISMHFSDLGPQEVSFPDGVEPPPLMVE